MIITRNLRSVHAFARIARVFHLSSGESSQGENKVADMANEELVTLVLILAFASCLASIPDGYILKISPDCGDDAKEDARIEIVTDLRAEASAICQNDGEINFNNVDGVNLYLPVSYPEEGNNTCIFQKRSESQVYVIIVLVSWGEPGNPVHSEQEEFFVTCTFDVNGQQTSKLQTIDQSLVAPIEVQTHLGKQAVSVFTLVLSDVLGKPVEGSSVALGRLVVLIATTDGASGEQGIRPVACDAIGSLTGKRYAIIRAGCGDGVVFSQDKGFITSNRTATSPYFGAFDMAGDPAIQFECNFTLCNKSCEGSSCINAVREKRESGSSFTLEGPYVSVVNDINISPLKKINSIKNVPNADDLYTNLQTTLYLSDVFWVVMLCVAVIATVSICISTCVYVIRKRRKLVTNVIE